MSSFYLQINQRIHNPKCAYYMLGSKKYKWNECVESELVKKGLWSQAHLGAGPSSVSDLFDLETSHLIFSSV